jgi:hypothetical protein
MVLSDRNIFLPPPSEYEIGKTALPSRIAPAFEFWTRVKNNNYIASDERRKELHMNHIERALPDGSSPATALRIMEAVRLLFIPPESDQYAEKFNLALLELSVDPTTSFDELRQTDYGSGIDDRNALLIYGLAKITLQDPREPVSLPDMPRPTLK